jgi:quercetin dioxygenase-like cupin family protein
MSSLGSMKGKTAMDQAAFEAELTSAGYTQVEAKQIDRRPVNTEHAHDYDIRGLVLDGTFIVSQNDRPVTYLAGEVFDVPAGTKHTEEIGPTGARIIVGRKY